MRRLFYRRSPEQLAFDLDALHVPALADPALAFMAQILALPIDQPASLAAVLGSPTKPARRTAKPASSAPRCGVMASGNNARTDLPDMPEWTGLPHGLADTGVAVNAGATGDQRAGAKGSQWRW